MKEQLIRYIENNQFLEARRKLDEILLLMVPGKSSVYYIVENAIAYMKAHYMESVTLSQVAAWVGVTPNYLSKLFVQQMCVNFSTYLNFLRVKQAEILLLKSELPIAAISERVGYADASYFIRVFRQYTHCTPAQFRCYYYQFQNDFLKNAH